MEIGFPFWVNNTGKPALTLRVSPQPQPASFCLSSAKYSSDRFPFLYRMLLLKASFRGLHPDSSWALPLAPQVPVSPCQSRLGTALCFLLGGPRRTQPPRRVGHHELWPQPIFPCTPTGQPHLPVTAGPSYSIDLCLSSPLLSRLGITNSPEASAGRSSAGGPSMTHLLHSLT